VILAIFFVFFYFQTEERIDSAATTSSSPTTSASASSATTSKIQQKVRAIFFFFLFNPCKYPPNVRKPLRFIANLLLLSMANLIATKFAIGAKTTETKQKFYT
jgi:hypothetical protein